jgi:hypothetical protein
LVLIHRPTDTARLARIKATIPAARLVIQKRCGAALVVTALSLSRAEAADAPAIQPSD